MDNSIIIAVLGLAGTVAVNLIAPMFNRRKSHADAAGAAVQAAERMIDQLHRELERKQAECDAKIKALETRVTQQDAEIGQAQEKIVALELRLDEQAETVKRQAAHLTIAAHQFKAAGIAPLWDEQ